MAFPSAAALAPLALTSEPPSFCVYLRRQVRVIHLELYFYRRGILTHGAKYWKLTRQVQRTQRLSSHKQRSCRWLEALPSLPQVWETQLMTAFSFTLQDPPPPDPSPPFSFNRLADI